jgi:hypothetical protein|tara:strand:- start:664 stop:870 length:207 start_codon:yes stop_codon:yes gene_type:complete
MAFRVVKQLYANPQAGDPEWAARNVYVARLSGSGDQIWEFDGESDANTKATELSDSDSSGRTYKVIEI